MIHRVGIACLLASYCNFAALLPGWKAAREVADYLGTYHHEFHFTVQEGFDAPEEVIQHIETYDVSTIWASTPMFLMSRKIKSLGVKMVLSGEGSDKIFGGSLYFHKAPSKEEFHQETRQKNAARSTVPGDPSVACSTAHCQSCRMGCGLVEEP